MRAMYLRRFHPPTDYSEFDPQTGTGSDFSDADGIETAGFCEQTEYGWVAVYPDPDVETLVVQIDGTTWDLYADETLVRYSHDYDEETTTFEIRDDDDAFEATYEAWWKGVDWFEPNRWAASREPENADEDFFGYLFMLWQLEEDRADFIEPWSERLPQ